MLKAFETRLKGFLASRAFCNVHEFFSFDWQSAPQDLTLTWEDNWLVKGPRMTGYGFCMFVGEML